MKIKSTLMAALLLGSGLGLGGAANAQDQCGDVAGVLERFLVAGSQALASREGAAEVYATLLAAEYPCGLPALCSEAGF